MPDLEAELARLRSKTSSWRKLHRKEHDRRTKAEAELDRLKAILSRECECGPLVFDERNVHCGACA